MCQSSQYAALWSRRPAGSNRCVAAARLLSAHVFATRIIYLQSKGHFSLNVLMHQTQKQMRLPDFAVLLDAGKSAIAASGLNPLGDSNSSTALPPVPAEEPLTAGVRGHVRQRRPVWRWHLQALVDGAWRALLSDKDLHVAVARTLAALQQGGDAQPCLEARSLGKALSSLQLRVVVGGGSRLECTQLSNPAPQQVTVETPAPDTSIDAAGTSVASTLFRVPSSAEAEGEHTAPRAGCKAPAVLPAVTALTRSSGNDKAQGHFGAPAAKHRHLDKRHVLGGLKVEERKLRRQRADAAAREKARQSELLRAAARDARAAVPLGGNSLRSAAGSMAPGLPASPMAVRRPTGPQAGGGGLPPARGGLAGTPSTTASGSMPTAGHLGLLRPGMRAVAAAARPASGAGLRASASGPVLRGGPRRPRVQLGKSLGAAHHTTAAPVSGTASAPSLAASTGGVHLGGGMQLQAGRRGGSVQPRAGGKWGLSRG